MKMHDGGFEMAEGEDLIGLGGQAALNAANESDVFFLSCAVDKIEVALGGLYKTWSY